MPSGYHRAKASVKRRAAKLFKVIVSSRQVAERRPLVECDVTSR